MRFHLPALQGQPVLLSNSSCAYTQKILKFARMMRERGHEVFIYGGNGGTDASVTEYVAVYGEQTWTGSWDPNDWAQGNLRAAAAIMDRKQQGDFLGIIAGAAQELIATSLADMPAIEYGIGYGGTFSDFRVFESYAWMHTVYGGQQTWDANGKFYDAVIPNYFDVDQFPFSAEKDDYVLYMGRVIERKGVEIAEQAAERAGMPLIIAGGEKEYEPSYGEQIGVVGPEERGELMAKAQALLCPTLYVEPFGGVNVEAQMCGTPAIATDWGAFTETILHGVTGYRARTIGEFVWAIQHAGDLDPAQIRELATRDYSLEAIAPQYEAYFEQVAGLRTGMDFNSDWEGLSRGHRYGRNPFGAGPAAAA